MQTAPLPLTPTTNALTPDQAPAVETALALGLTAAPAAETPVTPTAQTLHHIDGATVLLIHQATSYDNVFVYDTEQMLRAYRRADLLNPGATPTPVTSASAGDGNPPTDLCILGNIVVATFPTFTAYFYWRGDHYDTLPNKTPPIGLKVIAGLRYVSPFPETGKGDETKQDHPELYPDKLNPGAERVKLGGAITTLGNTPNHTEPNDDEKKASAAFTKLVAEWGQHGYLFQPVLVRAALRLKTGEISSLTRPVLCFPYSNPTFAFRYTDANAGMALLRGACYKPYAYITIDDEQLTRFADIVDSVEFYISAPIYTYDTRDIAVRQRPAYDGEGPSTGNFGPLLHLFPAGLSGSFVFPGPLSQPLSADRLDKVTSFYLTARVPFTRSAITPTADTATADYKQSEIYDYCADPALFGARKLLTRGDTDDTDLTTDAIVTLPQAADMLRPNIGETSQRLATYNARLITAGITYDLGTIATAPLVSYGGELFLDAKVTDPQGTHTFDTLKAQSNDATFASLANFVPTLYYPVAKVLDSATGQIAYYPLYDHKAPIDNDPASTPAPAIDLTTSLWTEETGTTCLYGISPEYFDPTAGPLYFLRLTFKQATHLNLARFTGEIRKIAVTALTASDMAEWNEYQRARDHFYYANPTAVTTRLTRSDYIRFSNVADPYTYPLTATAYMGSPVRRVLIVPEAISLGQYGQSQVYVLTDSGIYTVAISTEGKPLAVATYSTDIITHPDRATIAASRLIANNPRGWTIITRQQQQPVIALDRNRAFRFGDLPRLPDILPICQQWRDVITGDNLYRYLQSCTLRYDSRTDTLVGISPDLPVIALQSASHGLHLLPCPATHPVITMSGLTLAADGSQTGATLYTFDDAEPAAQSTGLIITRAIKFPQVGPDDSATLRSLILRGTFRPAPAKFQLLLYATDDYRTYRLIATSAAHYITGISGTPHKALRLVLTATLDRDESITHLTLTYQPRIRRTIPL